MKREENINVNTKNYDLLDTSFMLIPSINEEQTKNEILYRKSLQLLTIMKNNGVISEEDFKAINELNVESFKPSLGEFYQ